MKNRGFTLVELLAVLTVLAIIALIVVPIVSSSINRASVQSQKRSVEFYADAVSQSALNYRVSNGKKIYGIFSSSEDGHTLTNQNNEVLSVYYDKGSIKCDTVVIDENNKVRLYGCQNSGSDLKFSYSKANGVTQSDYVTCTLLSGSVNTQGSIIACGDEQFYVVSSDTSTITMLAKNNIETLESMPKQSQYASSTKFSDSAYWISTTSEYPADIYDENSDLYTYFNAYEEYLNGVGVKSAKVTAPNIAMLATFGCSAPNSNSYSCTLPEWATSQQAYWLGIAATSSSSSGMCVAASTGVSCGLPSSTSVFYARPLVTINKSEIK